MYKNLKNNKSPGTDNIINEDTKAYASGMLPVYITLFNVILRTGMIPNKWSEEIMFPIYKIKVSKMILTTTDIKHCYYA